MTNDKKHTVVVLSKREAVDKVLGVTTSCFMILERGEKSETRYNANTTSNTIDYT